MKKYLGILLLMIGMILIPGNVNALELENRLENCATVVELNKKITTCDLIIQNPVQNLDFEGGTLELTLTPTNENTTTNIIVNSEFATINTYIENGYVLDVKRISEGETVTIGSIEWIADANLPEQEIGGSVSFNWKAGSFEELDEDSLKDVPSSSGRDATVVEINEESPYYVFVSWGQFEYTYNNKGNGVYTWEPTHETSNVVTVENVGKEVAVSISWNAKIKGVDATYQQKLFDTSNIQCVVDKNVTPSNDLSWTDGKYYVDEVSEKFYTNSNCSDEVEIGTVYESNKYYHLEIVGDYSNESATMLSEAVVNKSTTFVSKVKWVVDLTGGAYEDVVDAMNSDKKIGTVTVTLLSTEVDLGE